MQWYNLCRVKLSKGQIRYSVPKRVQQLTGITNKTIKSLGLPFGEVMTGLTEFLHCEQGQSETTPVIIAHEGYSHDFTILLVSCMKHYWDKFGILMEWIFVDSVQTQTVIKATNFVLNIISSRLTIYMI